MRRVIDDARLNKVPEQTRQNHDLRYRNRSASSDWHLARVSMSELAERCRRRLGAEVCVVGDRACV